MFPTKQVDSDEDVDGVTLIGRRRYSLLMRWFMSCKPIYLYVSDTSCTLVMPCVYQIYLGPLCMKFDFIPFGVELTRNRQQVPGKVCI